MILPLLIGCALSATNAETLYTLNHKALAPADQVLAQSLQGLVGKGRPRIWFTGEGVSGLILDDLKKSGWPVESAIDPWSLVQRFRKDIRGVVVYKLGTHSLNVAVGLCGPMKAVAVEESQLDKVKANRLPILVDARGMSESEAFDKYKHLYKKGYVVEQSIGKPGHLRDFAVKHSAFIMDTRDREFRKRVVREMGPNALVWGWGPDELEWVGDISAAGGTGVAADWCLNLSALESLPTGRLRPPPIRPAKNEDGGRYVAFVLSDGDNVQWMTGGFVTESKFYGSPLRGKFPITWEVSPLLAKFAPRVLKRIYDTATPNDDFVAGPGLPGYTFPHALPNREALARQSAPYLRDSGLGTISILNQNEGNLSETFPWLDLREVSSAIYKDYSPYHRRRGEIVWRKGKPCVAYRFILWSNLMDIDELATEIGKMPTDPRRTTDSYALVNVHAWSFDNIGGPIEAIKRVVDRLPAHTRVITANQLLELLKVNHGRP